MIEAVRTTASTEAIWAIIIVAVCCLAFWLAMVMVADRQQGRSSGRLARPDGPGAEVPAGPPSAGATARLDPGVRLEMPAQRGGEGDRAERSGTADRDRR